MEAKSLSELRGCYQSLDCLWEAVVFPGGLCFIQSENTRFPAWPQDQLAEWGAGPSSVSCSCENMKGPMPAHSESQEATGMEGQVSWRCQEVGDTFPALPKPACLLCTLPLDGHNSGMK